VILYVDMGLVKDETVILYVDMEVG